MPSDQDGGIADDIVASQPAQDGRIARGPAAHQIESRAGRNQGNRRRAGMGAALGTAGDMKP